jgi:6-phosphogluconolactonase
MISEKKRTLFIVLVLIILSLVAMGNRRLRDLRATSEKRNVEHRSQANQEEVLVYVGTYTRPNQSVGIYRYRLDLTTGALRPAGPPTETRNPSFLAIHPSQRFLYAVNEIGDFRGERSGAVSAFAIDPKSGSLTLLNQQPSLGPGPAYLSVDHTGQVVLVANYGGGSVSVIPIQKDGRLGEPTDFVQHEGSSVDPVRQEGPHAHCVIPDPENRFALVADLGLDKILIYHLNPESGELYANPDAFAEVEPGAGPRHVTFHPNGRYAYVINELNSTITVFSYHARRGQLQSLQSVSALPEGFQGRNSCADIHVAPSGKFLYGSNRGHDSIVIFEINERTGQLCYVGHQATQGRTPRNFAIDPTGTFLLAANQDSNNIVSFRIDPQSGRLTPTGHVTSSPSPVCLQMLRMSSEK